MEAMGHGFSLPNKKYFVLIRLSFVKKKIEIIIYEKMNMK